MAKQIYVNPGGRRRRGSYGSSSDDSNGVQAQRQRMSRQSGQVSDAAQHALDDIDNVLAGQDALQDSTHTPFNPSEEYYDDEFFGDTLPDLAGHEGLYNDEDDLADHTPGGPGDTGEASNDDLQDAEDKADAIGSGYREDESSKGKSKGKSKSAANNFSKIKKSVSIIVALFTFTITVGSIVMFFLFLPLKLASFITNLQNRFTIPTDSAVGQEAKTMLNYTLKDYVYPSMKANFFCKDASGQTCKKGCSNTLVHKDCVDFSKCPPLKPSCRYFRAMYEGFVEGYLAKNGYEFGYKNNTYYFKGPGTPTDGVNLNDFQNGKNDLSIFDQPGMTKANAGEAILKARKADSHQSGTLWRFLIAPYINHKYHGIYCVNLCAWRKKISNALDLKTKFNNAARIYAIEHWIRPRSAALADALVCAFDPNCKPDQPVAGSDGTQTADNPTGEVRTVGEDTVSSAEADAVKDVGKLTYTEEEAKWLPIINRFNQSGADFRQFFLTEAFTKIGITGPVNTALGSAFNWVGVLNQLAAIITNLADLYQKLQYISLALRAAQEVQMAVTYQAAAAESKTGGDSAGLVGSFADTLSANGSDGYGTQVWQRYVEGKNVAGTVADTFNENHLTDAIAAAKTISTSIPPPVATVAKTWNATIGAGFGWIGSKLQAGACNIAQCNAIAGAVAGAFQAQINWLESTVFGSEIPLVNAGGADTSTMVIKGFDRMTNDTAHHVFGMQKLTDGQVQNMVAQATVEQKQEFESMSTFARLFDTNSSYSLVSRMALAMPTDIVVAGTRGMSTVLNNPLASLFSSFSSILTHGGSVFAASTNVAYPDSFGISQYGIAPTPENTKVMGDTKHQGEDPGVLEAEQHCSDTSASGPVAVWNRAAQQNNGDNSTVNWCLFLDGTGATVTGGYDLDNLPADSSTPTPM